MENTEMNYTSGKDLFPVVYVNRLNKESGYFTQICNHIIDAKSAEEIGLPALKPVASKLLQVLIKLPNSWEFSMKDMCERVLVGPDALRAAQKELVQAGYFKMIRFQDIVSGKFLGSAYVVGECAEFKEENKVLENKKSICHILKITVESFINKLYLPNLYNPKEGLTDMIKPYTNNTEFKNTENKNKNFKKQTTNKQSKAIALGSSSNSVVAVVSKNLNEENQTPDSKKNSSDNPTPKPKEPESTVGSTSATQEEVSGAGVAGSAPVLPVDNSGEAVDEFQPTDEEYLKLKKDLKDAKIGNAIGTELIVDYGFLTVKSCLQAGQREKELGNIKKSLSGWIIGALKKGFDIEDMLVEKKKKETEDKNKELLRTKNKAYLELFKYSRNLGFYTITDWEKDLILFSKHWINSYKDFSTDIPKRVDQMLSSINSLPPELKIKELKDKGIYGLNEEAAWTLRFDKEQESDDRFNKALSGLSDKIDYVSLQELLLEASEHDKSITEQSVLGFIGHLKNNCLY